MRIEVNIRIMYEHSLTKKKNSILLQFHIASKRFTDLIMGNVFSRINNFARLRFENVESINRTGSKILHVFFYISISSRMAIVYQLPAPHIHSLFVDRLQVFPTCTMYIDIGNANAALFLTAQCKHYVCVIHLIFSSTCRFYFSPLLRHLNWQIWNEFLVLKKCS